MTEEIIIDGVNVAGCNDFYKEWDNWSGKDNYRCQDFLSGVCAGNNCYYKQLKRLEQENKELKKTKGRCAFKSLDNTFCDEARIKIDKLELDKDCLNASLETARKYRGIVEAERDKYRSALEEIRIIADDTFKVCDDDCGNARKIKLIIDKINEVLGE